MFLRRVTGFFYIAALAAVTLVLYVPMALVLVVSMIGDGPAKYERGSSGETAFTVMEPERKRTAQAPKPRRNA